MSNLKFSDDAWDDYVYWQMTDKDTCRKILELLKDIQRNGPSNGIGKPERLRYCKLWSRRITHEHRLVYEVQPDGCIFAHALKGHYDDK